MRRAARRKLQDELGISQEEINLSDFKVLTRILYGAPSDSTWGEQELDYILFLKKDVILKPNPNEVSNVSYVPISKFTHFLEDLKKNNISITPWFQHIVQHSLIKWWQEIDSLTYDPKIHHF